MSTQPNPTQMIPLDGFDAIIQQMPVADSERYLTAFAANKPGNNPALALEAMRRKSVPAPTLAPSPNELSLDDLLEQEDTLDNTYELHAPRPN